MLVIFHSFVLQSPNNEIRSENHQNSINQATDLKKYIRKFLSFFGYVKYKIVERIKKVHSMDMKKRETL